VAEADFFRLRLLKGPSFALDQVTGFRAFGSRWLEDRGFDERVSWTF
jgi:hypothetical protein